MFRAKFKLFMTVLAGFLLFSACKSAPERYLTSFESFVVEIEQTANNYSDEQWQEADTRFEMFTGEEYKKVEHQLTTEQKKKVGELTARYYKMRAKSAGDDILDMIKGGLNYIEGFAEGLLNETNEKK